MAGLGQSGNAQVVNMNGYKQVQAAQPVQNKGNFFTHLLPTIAGTGGGIAGGAAGGALAGTAILPGIGTVAGGLLGALLGGAAGGAGGKVLENKVEHQALGNGVLGAGIENGVLSAGPLRLLKGGAALAGAGKGLAGSLLAPVAAHEAGQIAGDTALKAAEQPLKTSVAGKLDTFGDNTLGKSLFPGVTDKPIIRKYDPAGTSKKLFDMGLTKDSEVERTAQAITGSDGLLNQAVASAVGKAGNLEVGHLPSTVESAIKNSGLVESHAKGLTNEIMADVNLIDPKNPQSALDVMRNLKARQQEYLGKGGTYHLPTSADIKRAKAIGKVHDDIESGLYKQAGADKNLGDVLTPDLEQQLVDLHPGNAQWAGHVKNNIMNAKSVGDLRSAQAPFVNATNLIENGAGNAYSANGRMVTNTNGLKSMLVDGAANLVKQPVQRVTGIAAKKLAAIAPGAANDTSSLLGALSAPGAKSIIRNEVMGTPIMSSISSAMDGGKVGAAPLDPNQPQQGYSADQLSQMQADPTQSGQVATAQDPSQSADANSPLNPANVEQGIQAILAGGGKMSDVTAYVDLVKTVSAMQGSGTPKALNSTQQQQAFNAQSGLTSLNDIAAALQKNPNEAKLAALPGGSLTSSLTGTGSYKAAIANATDVIGRLRSGGAIGAEEEKQFKALLPQSFDSQQTASYKLNQLQTLFSQFANPQAAASDPSTLLSALGGQ